MGKNALDDSTTLRKVSKAMGALETEFPCLQEWACLSALPHSSSAAGSEWETQPHGPHRDAFQRAEAVAMPNAVPFPVM